MAGLKQPTGSGSPIFPQTWFLETSQSSNSESAFFGDTLYVKLCISRLKKKYENMFLLEPQELPLGAGQVPAVQVITSGCLLGALQFERALK